MTFPINQVVFFVFSITLLFAATMVIVQRNPVRAVLYLVLAFFASAALWMLLQAEFLALVLIFVYVGAVMTLFLFVVMMINIDLSELREKFIRYLPVGIIVMILFVGILLLAFEPKHFQFASVLPTHYGANYSNTKAIGTLLYTDYLFPFEIAAVILLVAIISAISLAFHGRKPDTKSQNMAQQHDVKKEDRIRIVKMKVEKP